MQIYKVVFLFYSSYFVISMMGNIFIDYDKISFRTIIIYFLYMILFTLSAYFMNKKTKLSAYFTNKENIFTALSRKIKIFNVIGTSKILISPNIVIIPWLILLIITISYTWGIQIQSYGGIKFIIKNAYTIRESSIGSKADIVNPLIMYFNNTGTALLTIIMCMFIKTNNKKYLLLSGLALILIALTDLLSFGRISLIYSVFIIVSLFLVFNIRLKLSHFLMLFSVFVITFIPRLIRGSFDNFQGTVSRYAPYFNFHLPSFLNPVISYFIYYFSSIFALDDYLSEYFENIGSNNLTYGEKMFTPVFNIFSRIFNFNRVNLIEPSAHIPFDYNIFSIIKDIIGDFGLVGLIIFPVIFGVIFGYIFKKQTFFYNCLKVYLLAWLFYTPIYNAFSFGAFFISCGLLLIFSLLFKMRRIDEKG
ncbi:hypothetical protein BABA_01580 [Neobacillus bataviensis LMG 21833]|uniref:Oligosaccharide repeat unit polymerase n=1 Tax=Neobacillus bataviensis LMG 21833 TaxID=1117379 RepID=K6DFK2_9BACI|nr:O-antigen polymerase [Neobacillus bataviensis]EKN71332.1 hypothetical protein BABA_01580 [Neobacillus bataviensis LMG 21833]